ncbi:hypothetical protein TEA_017618 [Camellia sinensis var. sinensis]|uniref:RING-type E3 ubiquitin transferase n=1 Tax=Camellia sinensis var. sinensis TaxID=542762 RepID=A0A4S4CW95_CAMSN|nr:hypothetical protein TEA_017618 [Camellia sinensis var. sinensis]
MGNIGSSSFNGRRREGIRRSHPPPPPPQPPHPEISANRYVFAAATPYPVQYPNPNSNPYYHYPGYYPPPPPAMPVPLPAPYDPHHHHHHPPPPYMYTLRRHHNLLTPKFRLTDMYSPPQPLILCNTQTLTRTLITITLHQKAVTIRNDVNLKKETLRIEPDEENPGKFLVAFTFDATVAGSITVIFFAKESEDCSLAPTKENLIKPVTMHFEQGLGQKFIQPSGTGIDFSMFDETELLAEGDMEVYPLAVKAEASPVSQNESTDENPESGPTNSQITKAVFEKEKGEYKVRLVKQILWVNGMRYELQEIYGIGNSVNGDFDGNDSGKECVCMCSGCAKVLRLQTNRCPICRQPVERLLEIKVSNGAED